ncbi:MAG: ribosome-binding factor A [Bacteroidetes bacterium]|nr:MAG: ribosome-binding factor A [Bacteroidota bacterium]
MARQEESMRQLKVARQLQRDLSEIFQTGAATYALGRMVTVTRVRVSPDLEYANVFLSVFPSKDVDDIMTGIRRQTREIRYDLGKRIRHQLRVVPELRFELDDSLDYIDRIDELLSSDS